MGDVETIVLKGEGGMLIHHDLPLPEHIADRLTKGHLSRVNEDGSNWIPSEAEDDVAPELGVPPTEAPDPKANKPAWVAWAGVCGMKPDDAEAKTKADLIDLYGKK